VSGETEAREAATAEPGIESPDPAPPAAQAQASGKNPDDWHFRLVPLYQWAMGLSGETTIGGRTVPKDVGFGDILDKLQFILKPRNPAGEDLATIPMPAWLVT